MVVASSSQSCAVYRLRAPAKVNLGLRVVGRRDDGLHELDSLFAPLDLCDDLEVRIAPADGIAVALVLDGEPAGAPGAGVPAGGDNLAARAATAFLEAASRAASVEIRLGKRIPAAAGLGGGSSDAGAVLRCLTAHFPGAVGAGVLAKLALGLGSDVPFFLDPRPSRVAGVGEQIAPLPSLPPLILLLAGPLLALSTAEVYRAWDVLAGSLTRPDAASTLRPPPGLWADEVGRRSSLAALLENDLEPAAVRLCPPIARIRERIQNAGALAVGMSGSGPSVFGIFESEAGAEAARVSIQRDDSAGSYWSRVATTVDSR